MALVQAQDRSVFVASYRGLYRARPRGRRVGRVAWFGRSASASAGVAPLLREGTRLWVGGLTDRLWTAVNTGHLHWPGPRCAERPRPPTDRTPHHRPGADPDGEIWIGASNGLNRYTPGSAMVQKVHATTAQPVASAGAGAAASAQQASALAARALRRAKGVVFQSCWTGAVACTEAGELLFGTSGRLTVVRPALLQPWAQRPPVVPTEMRVGGKPQGACRTWGFEAKFGLSEDSSCRVCRPIAEAMGQKAGVTKCGEAKNGPLRSNCSRRSPSPTGS